MVSFRTNGERAELVDAKMPATAPDALLREQHRAGRIQPDGERQREGEQEQHHQPGHASGNVHDPLANRRDGVSLSRLGHHRQPVVAHMLDRRLTRDTLVERRHGHHTHACLISERNGAVALRDHRALRGDDQLFNT